MANRREKPWNTLWVAHRNGSRGQRFPVARTGLTRRLYIYNYLLSYQYSNIPHETARRTGPHLVGFMAPPRLFSPRVSLLAKISSAYSATCELFAHSCNTLSLCSTSGGLFWQKHGGIGGYVCKWTPAVRRFRWRDDLPGFVAGCDVAPIGRVVSK